MNKQVRRAGVVTLLAMVLSVQALAATISCADFISSSGGDAPLTGYLVGESTRTTTKTYTWSYTNFGGTFGGSSTITQSYSVGTYKMSDGTTQQLRCDGYTRV